MKIKKNGDIRFTQLEIDTLDIVLNDIGLFLRGEDISVELTREQRTALDRVHKEISNSAWHDCPK